MMKPIYEELGDNDEIGMVFKDNLSSHKTDEVLAFWDDELPNFSDPRFIPANMLENLQVIDRHIGIRYKEDVYLSARKELTRRLVDAHAANGGACEVTIPSLTPKEKHILIMHVVGEFHEKITQSGAYEQGNIATGTLIGISHCLGESGPANLPEESEVIVQHLNKYNYIQECPGDKILVALKGHNFKMEDYCIEQESL